ncbi:MAG: BON domain-containing protein [Gammaproteobacteria bacterium]|nr:BON domain-containing protein [Gammaproteobacteria bacterium]MDE2346755.1 BON domain-containing protein [Gammaproteobacteria bacterium]
MQTPSEIIHALQTALEKDTDINLHAYPITISHPDRLRLEGMVENIIAKRKIRRIAVQLLGHADFEDHLYLETGERRSDKALLDALVDALSQEPAFRDVRVYAGKPEQPQARQWIAAHASGCQVTLEGEVGSLSHRRLAEVTCWWVPGTGNVHNHLRVVPPEKDSDDEITDAVLMILEKDPLLRAENITPKTHANTVTLNGYVHNREQARMAEYDCWYVPGVHDVIDQLRVSH